jgi:hypothetical protein
VQDGIVKFFQIVVNILKWETRIEENVSIWMKVLKRVRDFVLRRLDDDYAQLKFEQTSGHELRLKLAADLTYIFVRTINH